jgi:hypothetical protein
VILDTILALVGAGKVSDGMVVRKIHYSPTAVQVPSEEFAGHTLVTVAHTESVETWALVVRGRGRFGGMVAKEVPVDELEWNNTNIGDKYGAAH